MKTNSSSKQNWPSCHFKNLSVITSFIVFRQTKDGSLDAHHILEHKSCDTDQ